MSRTSLEVIRNVPQIEVGTPFNEMSVWLNSD